MKCDRIQRKIDAYLDRELPASEVKQVEEHLQACQECQRQMLLARRVTSLSQSFPEPSPADLGSRIEEACQKDRVSARSTLEAITMKKGIRYGVISATVACAAAFVALYPREAQGAAKAWAEMAAASAVVKAVHITNVWYLPDGKTGKSEIWTDGQEFRIEPGSEVEVVTGDDIPPDIKLEEGTYQEVVATPDGIDPSAFLVSEQIKMLSAGGSDPMDLGTVEYSGKTLRKIAIVNRNGTMRHTFWVDEATDLPAKKVDEERKEGQWVEVGYQTFEFMDTLPSDPPPAKK